MANRVSPYRPLTGWTKLGIAGQHRLYVGRDHLLAVARVWYTEHYRRFYFQNIRAIVITGSDVGKAINALLAMLLLFGPLAIAMLLDDRPVAASFCAVAALVGLIGLVINVSLGPTCACYLFTAVRRERLGSVSRLRKARRVLDTIRPLIEQVQGALPADAAVDAQAAAVATTPGGPIVPQPAGTRHDSGTIHTWLFALLLLDGVARLLMMSEASAVVWQLYGAVWLVAVISVILVALTKQRITDLDGPIKTLTYVAFTYILVVGMLTLGSAQNALFFFDSTYADLYDSESAGTAFPAGAVCLFLLIAVDIVLATAGFVLLRRRQDRLRAREAPAAQNDGEA